MNIIVNGMKIDKWANLSVSLIYASVKSIFSFNLWWDPNDAKMRKVMLPGAYNQCTVTSDSGEILITGNILSPSFKSSSGPNLISISGASLTAALDTSEYCALFNNTSAQKNGLSFFQICQNTCNKFGLIVLDQSSGKASAIISQSKYEEDQTCTEYLSEIARELGITLTHNNLGNLMLSVAGETPVVYNFTEAMPGFEFGLSFNGDEMSSEIQAKAQGGGALPITVYNPYVNNSFNYYAAALNDAAIIKTSPNGLKGTGLTNPPVGKLNLLNEYSKGYRPKSVTQTATDTGTLLQYAQQALADELKDGIIITCDMEGWGLAGRIVRPGDYITIMNPELYLFKPTKLFIDRIDFAGTESSSTAHLNIVVPEVYNGKAPINIFTANGNNTTFKIKDAINLRSQDRRGIGL